MIRRIVILFIALTALSCATATATSRSDEAGVRAAMNEVMDALNALDLPRIAAAFADDIDAFVPVAQGPRVEGKAALVKVFEGYIALQKTPTHLVPEDMKVAVSGDVGIVSFQIKNPNVTSRRTFVFRKIGGRWLITHFHASNFRPQ